MRRGPAAASTVCIAGPAVVEIDEVRALVRPQNVSRVTIAMQPERLHIARTCVAVRHRLQRQVHRALPRLEQVGWQERVNEQPVAGLAAEALHVQRRAYRERPHGADGVDAADEAPDPFQGVAALQFRRAAAAAREHREAEARMLEERPALRRERGHGGNLALGEFQHEGVLFQDLRVAPAPRAVELRHDGRAVFQPHLVDAVLVAVQAEQPPVAAQSRALERVENGFRGEPGVWRGHVHVMG
jgi:hypothetical protein